MLRSLYVCEIMGIFITIFLFCNFDNTPSPTTKNTHGTSKADADDEAPPGGHAEVNIGPLPASTSTRGRRSGEGFEWFLTIGACVCFVSEFEREIINITKHDIARERERE